MANRAACAARRLTRMVFAASAALMLALVAGCAQVAMPSLSDLPDLPSVSSFAAPDIKYCEGDYDGLVYRTEQTDRYNDKRDVKMPMPLLISDGLGDGATGVTSATGERENALRLFSGQKKSLLVASDVKKLLGAALVFKSKVETTAHSDTVGYGRFSEVDERDILACARVAQVEKIKDNAKRQLWSVTGLCANQDLQLQTLKNKKFVVVYEKVRHNCGPALLHKVDTLVETAAQ